MSILNRIGPNQTKDNIWKMGIFLVANKRTFVTLVSIYLLTMPGATIKTIGFIMLAGAYAGFLFEIPSGYISDKIGHKEALIVSRVCLALSTMMYVFATSINYFYAGAILMSIGFSFSSGTLSAFMHNTLKELKKEDQYSKIMGRLGSFGFAIPILFITTLPLLAQTKGMRLAFIFALVIDIIGLVTVLLFKKPKQIEVTKEIKPHNFKSSVRLFFSLPWVSFVLVGAIIAGIQFGAVAGFKHPYQELAGFSLSMLGILWATSRIIISQGLLFSGLIKKYFSLKDIILLRGFGYGASLFVAGMTSNKWVIALAFIAVTTIWHVSKPAYTHHLLEYIPEGAQKATLLSIKQQLVKIVSGLVGFVMGYLASTFGFGQAYTTMGIILFVFTVCFALRLSSYKP